MPSLAKLYLSKAEYDKAMNVLSKAVIREPDNGEIHYFLGLAFGYLEEYEKSKEEFMKARKLGYKK